MPLPRPTGVMADSRFRRYLVSMVSAQLVTQGTFAAILYQVYVVTGSTAQVGLVGGARALIWIGFSPIGGHLTDRYDRKTVLQCSQVVSLVASTILAVMTLTDAVTVVGIIAAATLNSAAATVENPARKALVPALVSREDTVQGYAVVNVGHEVGTLVGPAVGGLLIAAGGPGLVYAFDVAVYITAILVLATIPLPRTHEHAQPLRLARGLVEGLTFLRRRPLVLHLLGLDSVAMLFGMYRVVLPALALDVLEVGPTGYGLLGSAPSIGAMVGGVVAYRMASSTVASGTIVLGATAALGASVVLLGNAGSMVAALSAVIAFGMADAVAKTIRHAAIMLETPDELRGRIGAIYGMAAGGAPSLGELNLGWLSAVLGIPLALTIGGLVPIAWAAGLALLVPAVRGYRVRPMSDSGEPGPEGAA
jgi:MFS family permease